MKITRPQPGEGWGALLASGKANGGEDLPPELAAEVDTLLPQVECYGLTQDDRPSVIFTLNAMNEGEKMLHWASDGRIPLEASLDMLDALTAGQPGITFLAFVRRPALIRLLAGRGWTLAGHEANPFMGLMKRASRSDLTRQAEFMNVPALAGGG